MLSLYNTNAFILPFTAKNTAIGSIIRHIYGPRSSNPLLCKLRRFRSLQAILYALNARQNLACRHLPGPPDVLLGDRSTVTSHVVHYELFKHRPFLIGFEPDLVPDHVLLLDIPAEIAFGRLDGRKNLEIDETIGKMTEFRSRFLEFAEGNLPRRLLKTKWTVVDASRPVDVVWQDVWTWASTSLGVRLHTNFVQSGRRCRYA